LSTKGERPVWQENIICVKKCSIIIDKGKTPNISSADSLKINKILNECVEDKEIQWWGKNCDDKDCVGSLRHTCVWDYEYSGYSTHVHGPLIPHIPSPQHNWALLDP